MRKSYHHRFRRGVFFCTAITLAFCLSWPARAQDGVWVTKAPMPTARFGAAAAVVDGLVYVMGGCIGTIGNPVAVVEVYGPKSDTWTTKSPMPEARCAAAAGVIDGVIYVAGGYFSVGPTGGRLPGLAVEAYDPITDKWSIKAPIPTARFGLAAAVVNGILYTLGGLGSAASSRSAVEAYNPKADSWSARTPMLTSRDGLVAGVVDGIVYVTGATDAGSQATVEAYDPKTNIWTMRSLMPTPRFTATAGVAAGIVYVVGGSVAAGIANSEAEAYHPKTNTWSIQAPMPTRRSGLVAGVVDDILYAVGGQGGGDAGFAWYSVNEAFSPFLAVGIDIMPGDANNTINLKSGGVVPVAILGSATFDPMTVDPTTVTLAAGPVATRGRGVPMTATNDANHDGFPDLLLFFRTQDLKLSQSDTQAVLYGETFSGQRIRGSDSVRIVPPLPKSSAVLFRGKAPRH